MAVAATCNSSLGRWGEWGRRSQRKLALEIVIARDLWVWLTDPALKLINKVEEWLRMTSPQDLTYTCMHLHTSTHMQTCIHTYENEKGKPPHGWLIGLVAEVGAGENTGQLPQCHCLLYKAGGRTRYFHSYEALARGSGYKKLNIQVCLVYSAVWETFWHVVASVQSGNGTCIPSSGFRFLNFI